MSPPKKKKYVSPCLLQSHGIKKSPARAIGVLRAIMVCIVVSGLFHGDALGEVAGHVDVAAFHDGYVVGQQL